MEKSHSLAIANIINLARKLGYEATDEYKITTKYPNGRIFKGRIDVVISKNKKFVSFIEIETPITPTQTIGTPRKEGYFTGKPSYILSKIKLKSISNEYIRIIISSVKANRLDEKKFKKLLNRKSKKIIEIL
jgi:hypothetical protein